MPSQNTWDCERARECGSPELVCVPQSLSRLAEWDPLLAAPGRAARCFVGRSGPEQLDLFAVARGPVS